MQTTSRPKATSIDEYLAGVSDADKRSALERLRATIHSAIPGAEEVISYGMPGFRHKGKVVAWFAAAKNHCAFHAGGIINDFKDELRDYELSKGTIRFQPNQELSRSLVRKLILEHLERKEAGAAKKSAATSGKKINAKWHAAHPMPRPATLKQRIAWHRAHAKQCGCREIPKSLKAYM